MQHNYKHCPKPKMPIHELTLHAGLPSQHVKAVSVWSRQVFLGHTLLKWPEAKNRTWSTTRQVRLTISPNFSSVKLPADIPSWYIVLRTPSSQQVSWVWLPRLTPGGCMTQCKQPDIPSTTGRHTARVMHQPHQVDYLYWLFLKELRHEPSNSFKPNTLLRTEGFPTQIISIYLLLG